MAQSTQDEYQEYGFQYIYMATGDTSGSPPSQDELMDWADRYDMVNIPVLGFTSRDQSYPNSMSFYYEKDLYIPTIYHINGQMEVVSADRGISDPDVFIDD